MRWTMSVKVTRIEGGKFKAEVDGFEVLSGRIDDENPPVGMSPGRLMVASLGLCSAFHAASYLRRNRIEANDLVLNVEAKNEEGPRRASELRITVEVGAELSAEQVKGLLAELRRCYVGNTLRSGPKIGYEVKTGSS